VLESGSASAAVEFLASIDVDSVTPFGA